VFGRILGLEDSPLSTGFLAKPRQTRLRFWSYQLHFYVGLIAGLLWLVVGISGSFLVFIPELRRLEVPGWTKVQPTSSPKPIEEVVNSLLRERAGDKPFSIYWDFKPDWALNLRTVAPNGDRIHSFVDQYRAVNLGSVNYRHTWLQWFYDLHADLLGHTTGRMVNAWFAFALMLTSVTGLILWWRGLKQWKLGFEYRTKASWKRQVWDMHNLGGFLFYLPLFILSLTGAYYAYQDAYGKVTAAMTGGPAVIAPPKALTVGTGPYKTLDEIVANSIAALPGSKLSMILWPAKAGDAFTLRLQLPSDPHRIGLNWAYVDGVSGKVLRVDKFSEQPLGVQIIKLMTPIHYGTFGGYTTRILWLLAGLMPGVLFVTSLLMWWNRSLSKTKKKPAKTVAEPEPVGAAKS
jgi:uncharacterized iron-regulated membrane protein